MSDINKNSIYAASQLLWRKLPAHLAIAGPFSLIITQVDGSETPKVPPGSKPWGRLTLKEQGGTPTDIRQTRWRVRGLLTLQIFVSRAHTDGAALTQRAGDFFKDNWLIQTKADNVVYTAIRKADMPPSDGNYHVDFICNFYWDEVRKRS